MNPIDVTVRDTRLEWRRDVSDDVGTMLLASLSADPMTLDDLRWACLRFMPPALADELFRSLHEGPCAGRGEWQGAADRRLVIDLARREVFATWDLHATPAAVDLPTRGDAIACRCFFHWHDDWHISAGASLPEETSPSDPARQIAGRRADVRERLYGESFLPFLVEQSRAEALRRDGWSGSVFPPDEPEGPAFREMVRLARLRMGRWLQSPLGSGEAETVRDWLLRDCFHVERDLRDRVYQWEQSGVMPPGISLDSETAQRMGPGRHEVILYFEMLHRLTLEALFRSTGGATRSLGGIDDGPQEVPEVLRELRKSRDAWLDAPIFEAGRRSPRQLILMERQRTPVIVTRGEAPEDCDCPLCALIASQRPEAECWSLDDGFLTSEFPRFWVGGKQDFLRRPANFEERMALSRCTFRDPYTIDRSHADGDLFSSRPDPADYEFQGEPLETQDAWADGWVHDAERPGVQEDDGDAVAFGAAEFEEALDEEWLGVAARSGGEGQLHEPQATRDADLGIVNAAICGLDPDTTEAVLRDAFPERPHNAGPWRGVFFEKPPGEPSQDFLLLRFAACLTELVSDLQRAVDAPDAGKQLTRLFQQLLDAFTHDLDGLPALVSRFCETLDDLHAPRPELGAKVSDLQDQLLEMLTLEQDPPRSSGSPW